MKSCNKILAALLALLLVFGTAAVGGLNVIAYAVDGAGETTVRSTISEREITVGYKETQTFYFEAENVPLDAGVHVFLDGEDRGETTYICVKNPTEDYTVEAKVLDANGNVLAASGEIKVTVKNGFFDRALASVRNVFGTAVDAIGDILGAIFMRIWVFLHR